MCFSASASFGAGVVLTVIGVATIKKTHHPSQYLFAGIPFIFGVQQLAEGILWITLPNPDQVHAQRIATHVFLFFAQIIWPLWVPIAILLLEKSATRKNLQRLCVGAGFVVSAYLGYCLCTFPVSASIVGHHITYLQQYPISLKSYGVVLYAMATIAPSFFSHLKRMWMLGSAILVSYIVTAIFYEHYVLSVWCFLCAIISLCIYAIMVEISRPKPQSMAGIGV